MRMKNSKISEKLFAGTIVSVLIAVLFLLNTGEISFAEGTSDTTKSILPEVSEKAAGECNTTYNPDMQGQEAVEEALNGASFTEIGNWLGCGIKTGNIKLYMVPYYVRSILEFIIGISGLVCVGAIVFGGYWYLFAGISDDKERGKKAILYGVIGMVLTLLAWALVNILISLLTM